MLPALPAPTNEAIMESNATMRPPLSFKRKLQHQAQEERLEWERLRSKSTRGGIGSPVSEDATLNNPSLLPISALLNEPSATELATEVKAEEASPTPFKRPRIENDTSLRALDMGPSILYHDQYGVPNNAPASEHEHVLKIFELADQKFALVLHASSMQMQCRRCHNVIACHSCAMAHAEYIGRAQSGNYTPSNSSNAANRSEILDPHPAHSGSTYGQGPSTTPTNHDLRSAVAHYVSDRNIRTMKRSTPVKKAQMTKKESPS